MSGRATHHAARIHWSAEQVARGLPAVTHRIDPSWFVEAGDDSAEGWSLVCDFDEPPSVQGNPSIARVAFWMDHAPHDRLYAGVSLWLFERATRRYARVEIIS